MLFNEKLIQRRREKGMSQEDLAEKLSVSRQTVSKWENGDCMPDADKFIRLADILEISLDELAGREVEVEPIVLPAPELPQADKKLRRLLAVLAACLLFGAVCFCLGRYVFPAAERGRATAAELPDVLKVTGFSMSGSEARFSANASVDGTVFLYTAGLAEPVRLPAVYRDGMYAVSGIPQGSYERVVFVISAGGLERSAVVVEQLEFNEEGISFSPVQ